MTVNQFTIDCHSEWATRHIATFIPSIVTNGSHSFTEVTPRCFPLPRWSTYTKCSLESNPGEKLFFWIEINKDKKKKKKIDKMVLSLFSVRDISIFSIVVCCRLVPVCHCPVLKSYSSFSFVVWAFKIRWGVIPWYQKYTMDTSYFKL